MMKTETPYEVTLLRWEPFSVTYEVFATSPNAAAAKARTLAKDQTASHPDGERTPHEARIVIQSVRKTL
jgi:hypothetical protein